MPLPTYNTTILGNNTIISNDCLGGLRGDIERERWYENEDKNKVMYANYSTWEDSRYNIYLGGIISNYRRVGWYPLDDISSARWNTHRAVIVRCIRNSVNDLINELVKERNKHNTLDDETKTVFRELFNNLDDSKKNDFIKKYKDTKFGKMINDKCPCCNEFYNEESNKNSCMHLNCTKMCDTCYNTWKSENACEGKEDDAFDAETCPSCKQKQTTDCPICFEETGITDLVKSKSCSHYVCWKCFGMAYYKNHPITNCPTCRSNFIKG